MSEQVTSDHRKSPDMIVILSGILWYGLALVEQLHGPVDVWLSGWPMIVADVALNIYLCWLAYCFIRTSAGRERILLSSRARMFVAVGVTAFVLVLAVRGALKVGHHHEALFLGAWLHGWPLIVVNAALYIYVCWLGYCLIRASAGPERLFVIGWFVHIVLWPADVLGHRWTVAMDWISSIGLAIALLSALSLMIADRNTETAGSR